MRLRLARRTPEDAAAFCALSNSLYARKVTPAYFDWQFHDSPNTPALTTAWEGDRMIGAYGVHICAADSSRPGRAMMLDNLVAADFQGRGLVRDLAGMAFDHARAGGAEVLCVVANARSLRAHERHFGWSPWQTLRDWQSSGAAPGETEATVSEVENPDSKLAAMQDTVFHARTPEFLAWRTRANPRYNYRWIEARSSGGERLGQACAKLFRDPKTGESIGDIVALHPALGADPVQLIDAVRGWLNKQSMATVVTYPINAGQEAALRRLGFEPTMRERYVIGQGPASVGLEWGMLDVDVY